MQKQISIFALLSLVLSSISLIFTFSAGKSDELTLEILRSVKVDEACTLVPMESVRGAIPFPVKSNPFVSDDSQVKDFVSMWMLPPGHNEEELAKYTEEQFMSEVELIESVYVAIYKPVGGGPETGVYGLQFTEEVPEELKKRFESNTAIVSGKLVVLVWTDAKDRSCYQAIRTCIETTIKIDEPGGK